MKRILVADDNPASRELVRTVLENMGYETFEAADGRQAIEQARSLLPDLIVLDLHMPHFDGFAVVGQLRQEAQFGATPIVALTASAMTGDRERAIASGFTGYLAKPIGLKALRSEIQRLLG